MFGLHDIYRKLLPFVQEWRGVAESRGGAPLPLYFSTVDIRHCYDTIPHQMLCERVLPLVLREPAYVCGRYARVSYRPPRPDEAASAAPAASSPLHVRYLHCAYPLRQLDQQVQRSRGGEPSTVMQPWRKRATILVNQESQSVVDREAILATIREHVTQNIIKVDGGYLRTKTGIPQGSVLSVLLCGLFYAHLENHLLRPLIPLGFSDALMGVRPETRNAPNGAAPAESRPEQPDRGSSGPADMRAANGASAEEPETQELPDSRGSSERDDLEDLDAEDSDATVELDSSDMDLLEGSERCDPQGAAAARSPASLRTPEQPQIPTQHALLLRLVDDFLYITTDLTAARLFVRTLHNKIPDYGCTVHQAKTQISFEMGETEGPVASLRPMRDRFMPWCGLLLNTATLEVQADYSRYVGEDFRLRDSFTVEAAAAVGNTLRRRLYSFLRPKCHGVLLDTRINSVQTVWLNIYQAFMLAAIKFHCYTRVRKRSFGY